MANNTSREDGLNHSDIKFAQSGKKISEDHFGVIVNVDSLKDDSDISPNGHTKRALEKLLEGAIRFPAGGPQELIDFSKSEHRDALERAIFFCSENDINLDFTIQVRNFLDPITGAVNWTEDEKSQYAEDLARYLLKPADELGVRIKFQLGNEITAGSIKMGTGIQGWADHYAEVVSISLDVLENAASISELSYFPDVYIDAPPTSANGSPTSEHAQVAFASAFAKLGPEKTDLIRGFDIHDARGATLKVTDDALRKENGFDSFSFLEQQTQNFVDAWIGAVGGGIPVLRMSAWSLPGSELDGANLANSSALVAIFHAFSRMGVDSAAYYTLRADEVAPQISGSQQNALWYEPFGQSVEDQSQVGYLRPAGNAFNMMSDSIVGLRADTFDALQYALTAQSESIEAYTFSGDGTVVIYLINQSDMEVDSIEIEFEDVFSDYLERSAVFGATPFVHVIGSESVTEASSNTNSHSSISKLSAKEIDEDKGLGLISISLLPYEIVEIEFKIGHQETINEAVNSSHKYSFGNTVSLIQAAAYSSSCYGGEVMYVNDELDRFENSLSHFFHLAGGRSNDLLVARLASDNINCADGADELPGGAGDDTLGGVLGDDLLFDGRGADVFEFVGGHDTIGGYTAVDDTLALSEALWGGGLSTTQVLANFADDTSGTVIFDFGDEGTLTLTGLTDTAQLTGELTLF